MGVENSVVEPAGQTTPGRASWPRPYLSPLILGYLTGVPFVAGLILLERAAPGRATETLRLCLVLALGAVGLVTFRIIMRRHEARHGRGSKLLRACWGILLALTALGCLCAAGHALMWFFSSYGR